MSILVSLIGLCAVAGGGLAIAVSVGEGVVAMALGGLLIATGVLMLGFARLLIVQRDLAMALDEIARATSGGGVDRLVDYDDDDGEAPPAPAPAPPSHVGGRSEPRL